MLEAVIFDLDGVITDSASYHYQAWKIIADELKIDFDETYNEKLKGVSRMGSLELILDNGPGKDAFSQEEKERLCTRKNDLYKELIKQITPNDLLPGIGELLKELKANHVLIGLASVSLNAPAIINSLGIKDMFDYMADAAGVKESKPAPDIFLDNIKGLKVNPANSIGVEDAEVGIEAIHRAGMKACGIGSVETLSKADLLLSSTAELSLDKLKAML